MTTTNPRDETRTTETPHSRPAEHTGPNPSEEHLSLDSAKGDPTSGLLESHDLAEEHSVPGRLEEHPIPDHPEEHPRLDLSAEPGHSKSIEELLCDFENHQKQQLQILRAITHKIINTSQRPAAEPALHKSGQPTIEVSLEDREKIQKWNSYHKILRTPTDVSGALLSALSKDSEMEKLKAPAKLCITAIPQQPRRPLPEHRPDGYRSLHSSLKTIPYWLDNFGRAITENDSDFTNDLTENGLICARVMHNFTEYLGLSLLRIDQMNSLFVNFTAEQPNQDDLSSHMLKFVLGYALEWKVFKWSNACTDGFSTLQFSINFFEIALDDQKLDIERLKWHSGRWPRSELFREIGRIPLPKGTGSTIAERRASVLMAYGRPMNTPYWTIFNFSGRNTPRPGEKDTEETRHYFLDGVSHFRAWFSLLDMELHNCLLAWQKLLSEMDVGIGLKIDELCDPQTLGQLMRDGTDSKRSEFYFVSFSMLRKFADCIEETLEDLKHCCQEVNSRLERDGTSAEGKEKIQEISRQLLETHRGHFQDLIHRIQKKIGMIMPLQESLFNSTSIREASEATHQGRYIFVFTIMTIVYLPLGFVTSLFGMNNITETSPLATSMAPFAVTFSIIVAVTYIIASGSFPFANRTKFSPILGPIWRSFRRFVVEKRRKTFKFPLRPVSNNNSGPISPSPKSHALKRIFSFFQKRRSQPAEASRDVENGGDPAAVASATAMSRGDVLNRLARIATGKSL